MSQAALSATIRTSTDTPPDKPVEQAKAPERPAWLPEKFKTPEDMAKAYAELEKKQGTPPKDEQKPEGDKPKDEQKPEEKKEQATPPGLKKFQDEYAKNGKLADESYAELEKLGIDRATVDAHIAATKATSDNGVKSIYDSVGGQDTYKAMIEWASTGLSAEDIEAYDRAVSSGDIGQIRLAVKGLHAEYSRANPTAPNKITGKASGSGQGVEAFRSMREYVDAIKDPRYMSSAAYRADIDARFNASKL